MGTLGQTTALCPVCRKIAPTKVVTEADEVHFVSFCPEHGALKRLVRRGVQIYLQAQRNVRPAWVPRASAGDPGAACPEGCGFCDRHEQHLCLPIIEITNRCDLDCPICLVDAGNHPVDPGPLASSGPGHERLDAEGEEG
jgi:uncharacterized radical SAM superfamily Fe-S cluster-containing enzyme